MADQTRDVASEHDDPINNAEVHMVEEVNHAVETVGPIPTTTSINIQDENLETDALGGHKLTFKSDVIKM